QKAQFSQAEATTADALQQHLSVKLLRVDSGRQPGRLSGGMSQQGWIFRCRSGAIKQAQALLFIGAERRVQQQDTADSAVLLVLFCQHQPLLLVQALQAQLLQQVVTDRQQIQFSPLQVLQQLCGVRNAEQGDAGNIKTSLKITLTGAPPVFQALKDQAVRMFDTA